MAQFALRQYRKDQTEKAKQEAEKAIANASKHKKKQGE